MELRTPTWTAPNGAAKDNKDFARKGKEFEGAGSLSRTKNPPLPRLHKQATVSWPVPVESKCYTAITTLRCISKLSLLSSRFQNKIFYADLQLHACFRSRPLCCSWLFFLFFSSNLMLSHYFCLTAFIKIISDTGRHYEASHYPDMSRFWGFNLLWSPIFFSLFS